MRVPRTVVGGEEQEVCNLDPKKPVLKEQLETVEYGRHGKSATRSL